MMAALPEIIEVKRRLDGRETAFRCGLLARRPDYAAVAYASPAPIEVHGVALAAGTLSIGHFWSGRPYNVYHWHDRLGVDLGMYFNVADETRIGADIRWRDLLVDVLLLPGQPARVLDQDEVPADAPASVRATIAAALAALTRGRAVPDEVAALSLALWPAARGEGPR